MSDPDDFQSDGDDHIQALIGVQLRTLYDTVLNEQITDNIISLQTQLDGVPYGEDRRGAEGGGNEQE